MFRSAALLLGASCWLVACGSADQRVVATAPAASGSAPASAAPAGPLVDVAGHVHRPGVYRVAVGARVHDAIRAAGGARVGADLALLNRAAPVTDGQQILVVRAGAATGSAVLPGARGASVAKISLARATAEQLDALPGIGPVTAQQIVAERTSGGAFADVDDLDRVPGIGPATIEQLRDLVTP